MHGSVRPLVALILTKNCLNWVKLSVKGRICCNLVATECNSDFACCGNVVYLGFCLLWNWTSLISSDTGGITVHGLVRPLVFYIPV